VGDAPVPTATSGIEGNFVAASNRVYGAHDDPPHRESNTFEPRHPYDVSKAATGPAGISYWHTFG
jgi:GDP-D-mannose dehydratase